MKSRSFNSVYAVVFLEFYHVCEWFIKISCIRALNVTINRRSVYFVFFLYTCMYTAPGKFWTLYWSHASTKRTDVHWTGFHQPPVIRGQPRVVPHRRPSSGLLGPSAAPREDVANGSYQTLERAPPWSWPHSRLLRRLTSRAVWRWRCRRIHRLTAEWSTRKVARWWQGWRQNDGWLVQVGRRCCAAAKSRLTARQVGGEVLIGVGGGRLPVAGLQTARRIVVEGKGMITWCILLLLLLLRCCSAVLR